MNLQLNSTEKYHGNLNKREYPIQLHNLNPEWSWSCRMQTVALCCCVQTMEFRVAAFMPIALWVPAAAQPSPHQ